MHLRLVLLVAVAALCGCPPRPTEPTPTPPPDSTPVTPPHGNCRGECNPGEETCFSQTTAASCLSDQNGCGTWREVECAEGLRCDKGHCAPGPVLPDAGRSCADVCRLGELRCDADGYYSCARTAEGCLDFDLTNRTVCPGMAHCDPNNGCMASCTDVCSMGQFRCDGSGYVPCARTAQGCLDYDFSKHVDCPVPANGTARCDPSQGCIADCRPPYTTCGSACADLTSDTQNCGACGKKCTAGCTNGVCDPEAIATRLYFPANVVSGGGYLLYTDGGKDAVYRMPASGGAATPLVTGLTGPANLVTTGTTLLFEDKATVYSVDIVAGGTPKPLATGIVPGAWLTDGTTLTWALPPSGCTCFDGFNNSVGCQPRDINTFCRSQCGGCTAHGSIQRENLDGTGKAQVAGGTIDFDSTVGITTDGTGLLLARTIYSSCTSYPYSENDLLSATGKLLMLSSGVRPLTASLPFANADYLFYPAMTLCSGGVETWMRVISSGGTPEAMPGGSAIVGLTRDGPRTYARLRNGDVYFVQGTQPPSSAKKIASGASGVTADGTWVYFSSSANGTISRMPHP